MELLARYIEIQKKTSCCCKKKESKTEREKKLNKVKRPVPTL